MRELDWDASVLGRRDHWPSQLKVLVSLMLASAQPMVIAWGAERIFFYNDAYIPILGTKLPGAFGQAFFDVWPEVREHIGALFDRVFSGEAVYMGDINLALDRGNGPEETHFSFSYTPIRDDMGVVAGLFCTCNETTAQVIAQNSLENERQRQQRMLNQMPGFAAMLAGPDHILQYVNEAFVTLCGPRRFVGRSVREAFPEMEGQGFLCLLDQVYASGLPFNRRAATVRFIDGPAERFIDLNLQPIKDDAGQTTGVFVGGYDVTEAERSSKALRKSEDLMAALVASSDDAIISKTVDGVVTSWNRGAERLLGYTAAEMIGAPIALLALPGRESEMPDLLARLRKGERIEHFETARRHKDGSTVFVSLTVSPIHDEDGRVVGASKVARDVTAARISAEALQSARTRLEEQHRELLHAARLGEMGQMAATLAHEINQPLSAIINYLHAGQTLLSVAEVDRPMLGEALQRASDQAVRTAEVVRRLRTFAKPNEGRLQAESITEILQDATALAAIDAGRRGVAVRLAPNGQSHLVVADRIEIQQVLLNLIRNALEAMEGQPDRELSLSTSDVSEMVEVAVADTGTGLLPAVRERLFQPFVTSKDNGMGIGLSVSRKIVEAHGGRLWAEDRQDGGAVFRFTLRKDTTGRVAPTALAVSGPDTDDER